MARILFFGKLADLAGRQEIEYDEEAALSQIIASLAATHPELGSALKDKSTRAALNLHLVDMNGDPIVRAQDELAFMPPVSGG